MVLATGEEETEAASNSALSNNNNSNMAVVYVCKVIDSVITGLVQVFLMSPFSASGNIESLTETAFSDVLLRKL